MVGKPLYIDGHFPEKNVTLESYSMFNVSTPSKALINQKLISGCTEDAIVNCGIHTLMSNADDWMLLVHDIHYYGLPCILILGVLLAFVNCVVTLRQVQTSLDCYVTGIVIATLLLLICAVLINLKLYVGHLDVFGYIYGYIRSLQEWFWYTTIWLLIVMSLERCMNLSGTRNKSICSSFQAGITVVMTYLVCLVSALPRFWEFEPKPHNNFMTNQTNIVAYKSESTDTPEYNVMYYWYIKIISLFLPLLCFIVIFFVMCCGIKKPATSKQRLVTKKHSTGQVMKRKINEEVRLTQLLLLLIFMYVLLTSPYTVLKFLYKMDPMFNAATPLYATLEKLFQLVFYLNYTLHFFWLICLHWGIRKAFQNTCCCCCCSKENVEYEPANQRIDYY